MGRIIEIGGSEVVTYGEMMKIYADVRGLRRWLLPVPFLTPRLSSLWVNLVTPIPSVIARPLIEGLRNENIVNDLSARALFPDIQPVSYRTSVERALSVLEAGSIETTWSDALSTSQGASTPVVLTNQEGMIREHRQLRVAAPGRRFMRFAVVWVASVDGYAWIGHGRFAVGLTACLVGSGCGVAAEILTICVSETPWIFGGWRG
jgi:hypothetical protein